MGRRLPGSPCPSWAAGCWCRQESLRARAPCLSTGWHPSAPPGTGSHLARAWWPGTTLSTFPSPWQLQQPAVPAACICLLRCRERSEPSVDTCAAGLCPNCSSRCRLGLEQRLPFPSLWRAGGQRLAPGLPPSTAALELLRAQHSCSALEQGSKRRPELQALHRESHAC